MVGEHCRKMTLLLCRTHSLAPLEFVLCTVFRSILDVGVSHILGSFMCAKSRLSASSSIKSPADLRFAPCAHACQSSTDSVAVVEELISFRIIAYLWRSLKLTVIFIASRNSQETVLVCTFHGRTKRTFYGCLGEYLGPDDVSRKKSSRSRGWSW